MSRAGSKSLVDFTKAFVDAVYAKLPMVESLDSQGNVVRRGANAWQSRQWARADAPGL